MSLLNKSSADKGLPVGSEMWTPEYCRSAMDAANSLALSAKNASEEAYWRGVSKAWQERLSAAEKARWCPTCKGEGIIKAQTPMLEMVAGCGRCDGTGVRNEPRA